MGAVGSGGNGGGNKEKNYERIDAGVYPGRCIQVVELGTHEVVWEGQTKLRKELMIVWELSELMEDGRPFVVSWRGTNSLGEKSKLFAMLSQWRGKPFTKEEVARFAYGNLLDKVCLVNVGKATSKKGKDYNFVISLMPLPKGMTCPERHNELIDFGIDDRTTPLFEKLYPYVQTIIKESKEFSAAPEPESKEAF